MFALNVATVKRMNLRVVMRLVDVVGQNAAAINRHVSCQPFAKILDASNPRKKCRITECYKSKYGYCEQENMPSFKACQSLDGTWRLKKKQV